jgi:predicted transcriptional regulator
MSEPKKSRGHPHIVGIDKGIGPLEAQVMRTISGLPAPVTVRDVCDALEKDGYFAYQGILNCMNRLVKKGILERARQGGSFTFWPLIGIEELAAQVVSNVLGHMGGKSERVISRVLDMDPDLGAEGIAELRKKVRAVARQKKE